MGFRCDSKLGSENLEEFSARYLEILNHGALCLMISIGHRTGLFDALHAYAPCTSEQLANGSGLNERYVREWLGAMIPARIVDCENECFSLREGPLQLLTRGPSSLAHLAQIIGLLGEVETRVIECFQKGGGVPYDAYSRFHEVMAEDSAQTIVAPLLDHILPLVPGLADRLRNGIDVLDIGCGRGEALHRLASTFPRSRFVGMDLSREAIAHACQQADNAKLRNLHFEVRDLTAFDSKAPESAFDLVTAFDAIHDQARPDKVLAGVRRSLKPEGVFLMQDIRASSTITENRDHPVGVLLYTVSCMHCMTTSLAQGGMGLGTMWGEQRALEFLKAAGFARVEVRTLEHDIMNNYYIALAES